VVEKSIDTVIAVAAIVAGKVMVKVVQVQGMVLAMSETEWWIAVKAKEVEVRSKTSVKGVTGTTSVTERTQQLCILEGEKRRTTRRVKGLQGEWN
jgi:hypothetical protein